MRSSAAHSTEDPGGHPEGIAQPEFHEGLSHRPVVTITNSNIPKVQQVPEYTLPYRREALSQFKALMGQARSIVKNGHARVVAMDGGLLQHPAGEQPEGTIVHLYPIFFTEAEHAEQIERRILEVHSDVSEKVNGAVFHRFVGNPKDVIYEMQKEEAQRAHAERMGVPHLFVPKEATTGEGDEGNIDVHHPEPNEEVEELREVASDA